MGKYHGFVDLPKRPKVLHKPPCSCSIRNACDENVLQKNARSALHFFPLPFCLCCCCLIYRDGFSPTGCCVGQASFQLPPALTHSLKKRPGVDSKERKTTTTTTTTTTKTDTVEIGSAKEGQCILPFSFRHPHLNQQMVFFLLPQKTIHKCQPENNRRSDLCADSGRQCKGPKGEKPPETRAWDGARHGVDAWWVFMSPCDQEGIEPPNDPPPFIAPTSIVQAKH